MKYIKHSIKSYLDLLRENTQYLIYGAMMIFMISMWYIERYRFVYYPGMPFSVADGLFASENFRSRVLWEVPILFFSMVKISQDTYRSSNVLKIGDFQKVWVGQVVKCILNAVFLSVMFLVMELIVNLKYFSNFVNFSDPGSIFARENGFTIEQISAFEVIGKYLVTKIITLTVISLVFSILNLFWDRKKSLIGTFFIHVMESYFYLGLLAANKFLFLYSTFTDDIIQKVEICILLIVALALVGFLLVKKKDIYE